MKKKTAIIIVASMFMLTGCGKSDSILDNYNKFVECINTGDYSTAYNYVDTSTNMFMDADSFEESMYYIDTVFLKADKAKKNEGSWNFISGDVSQTFKVTNEGKLLIPELTTELELYVPTGSSCTYNGVALNNSMITSSDEIETVYTIQAPVAPGVLNISTELFGDSERTVDPLIGDINDFSISNELTDELNSAVINKINEINKALEADDFANLKIILADYISDTKVLDTYTNDFLSNRKLDDTFTSYHNPLYTITNASYDLHTSTSVDVSATFNIKWEIGEGAEASMSSTGDFVVSRVEDKWEVTSIDSWNFMYLTVVGVEQ